MKFCIVNMYSFIEKPTLLGYTIDKERSKLVFDILKSILQNHAPVKNEVYRDGRESNQIKC